MTSRTGARGALLALLLALAGGLLLPAGPGATAASAPTDRGTDSAADGSAADRSAAGQGGHGAWRVAQLAPGRYAVTWTSPQPLPLTGDRPRVLAPAAYDVGTATVTGRTVRVVVEAPTRPDPARLGVELSGRRLDQVAGAAGRRAPAAPDPALDLPGTITLPEDPAAPGPYAVTSSDYRLAGLKVPGMRQPIEMVGHVVEPAADAATGPRPLVLFLHGRHYVCYRPGHPNASSEEWPCRAPFREVPSQLGYDYLQRRLASQGYATVSVRANGINAQDGDLDDGGADARARLVRAHLDHWVGLAAAHQVDLDRVVLIGHSRGGEGVDRAALRIPLSAPYRIAGQVLIAPTDFAAQTAPYVPTVTLLPYCDGDVSDLQGQRFTDTARDLTADDTSLKSSVLVMGANHNYFNTEWTPRVAAAPANDDWWGPRRETCGTRDPQRLSAREQRAVGTAYVAGAVHLFAADDERVLPLYDGTRARVASQGAAQTLSHAIGGGRDVRTPSGDSTLTVADGAQTRFCRGVFDYVRMAACGQGVAQAMAAPLWPMRGEPLPARTFFEMTWTAAGQSGGLRLRSPLDLTDRRLELRTIVDRPGGAALRVRLTDAAGQSALLTPVGERLPGLGSTEVRKLWAQALIVDPAGAGIDVSRVVAVDLVAASGAGRLWVADLAAAPDSLAPVPQQRLPLVELSSLRLQEGRGGQRVARLPFRVVGTLTQPARLAVATFGDGPQRLQRFTVDLAAGQTSGSIPVGYEADTRPDYPRLVTQVAAFPLSGAMTDAYTGTVTILDDDPRPRVRVTPVRRRVAEGQPARWRVRVDRRADYDIPVIARVVKGPRPWLQVGDVPRRWLESHVGEAPPSRPLWRARASTYDLLRAGQRRLVVSVPTVRDRLTERPESLTLRFVFEGRRMRPSTVRIVSR